MLSALNECARLTRELETAQARIAALERHLELFHPDGVGRCPDSIEVAFKAGYHCRWHREQGEYCFDPAMSPGDPDGAYAAWRKWRVQ